MWRVFTRDATISRRTLEMAAGRRLIPMRGGQRRLCCGPSASQMTCPHRPADISHGASQYASWTKCGACDLRLDYQTRAGSNTSKKQDEMQETFQRFIARHIEEGLQKFRSQEKVGLSRTRSQKVVKSQDVDMCEFHTVGAEELPPREKMKTRAVRKNVEVESINFSTDEEQSAPPKEQSASSKAQVAGSSRDASNLDQLTATIQQLAELQAHAISNQQQLMSVVIGSMQQLPQTMSMTRIIPLGQEYMQGDSI